ncbi:hypothetical protein V8B97DRAFT_465145 [Scleroderma yunnanense]
MSARSFTVFQDSPAETPQIELTPAADATLVSTQAAIEKENLHPVTGERTGPASSSESKKRKTAALSTKLLVEPSKTSKKHRELKSESTKKQRKQLSSSGKLKAVDARKSTRSKRHRSPRKASPLPPVQEEPDVQREPARLTISQATINSRCYELTVSPLADVSEAYETVSQSEHDSPSDDERSVEHDHRLPTLEEKQDIPVQHTPKRKRNPSKFTFSSPSSCSERFRRAQTSPTRSGRINLQSN